MNLSEISQLERHTEAKIYDDHRLTTGTLEQMETQVTDDSTGETWHRQSFRKQESVAVIFGTTFLTIFLAEIGDKTQLSTLLMSAESQSPWVVFVGSAAALVTTSLLGVVLGSWIACRVSPRIVEKAAGVMLLLISLMLFGDLFFNC